ncbi:MAG: ATPase, T2SS/T4P/T4SS family [Planctomycetia bacterium]|nr:ATPase, T2SS/T4P/T4SS family [Planctomycetia bacterium]
MTEQTSTKHVIGRTCLALLLVFGLAFFVANSVSYAQAPPDTSGAPKRLYTEEQMTQIKAQAERAMTDGWRKDGGHYFSVTKIATLIFVFWIWLVNASWANCDAEHLGDPDRLFWNTLQVSLFPALVFVSLWVPLFWAAFPVVFCGVIGPMIAYIVHRNRPLLEAERVMTPSHILFCIKRAFGMKVKPTLMPYEKGSPIKLAAGGKDIDNITKNARTILARNMAGFNQFREVLYNSLQRGATMVLIDFMPNDARVQFQLDGVWHPIEGIFHNGLPREEMESMKQSVKKLCGVNPDDCKSRQVGQFYVEYDKKIGMDAEFISQGTPNGGEQFAIRYTLKKIPFTTLDELGMVPARQERFKKLINADKGLVVLSAPHGHGLRSLTNVAFNVADRFTRDFSTVEDVQNPYPVIENVALTTYDSAKGQKPIDVLPDVFFREPKVLLLRDLGSTSALTLCCEEVANDRLIITTFRGRDSVDTLMKMLKTGIDRDLLINTLVGICTQKLVRLLCKGCREEIPANPQVVKRLTLENLPNQTHFRKSTRLEVAMAGGPKYVPCKVCHEIGFLHRVGIFDILFITDELRELLRTNPTELAVREAVAKSGQHGFLDDGARIVAYGDTAFEELARILR